MKTENEKVKSLVQEILSTVKQMVISTCKDNKSWSATVLFAFDDNLNLYFFSAENRRHSREISENPSVSGAISREHTKGLKEPSHRGVQFQGECKLAKADEVKNAYNLFKKRFPEITEFHKIEDAPKELYKIEVSNFVLFDTQNFPKNPRKELAWQN